MELAKQRNIDEETINRIEAYQNYLNELLSAPDKIWKTPGAVPYHITLLEFSLQALWDFPQDKTFHRYSYMVKWCTCPKLDNDDMVGHTDKRYINCECPYHGTNKATSWNDERFN